MLTPEEKERVRAAVKAAEASLAAEIVPCVFAQSSSYPETTWAGAACGAAAACAAFGVADLLKPVWWPVGSLMLAVCAAGIAGAALGRWCAPLKRFFLGEHRMDEAVARRAKEVFFDRGVADTNARDGVLIFVSRLERRAVVLADEAIRAKVPPDAWKPAVAALTEAAAGGRLADGLVAAAGKAAEALRAAGLAGRGGGELGDEPLEGGAP